MGSTSAPRAVLGRRGLSGLMLFAVVGLGVFGNAGTARADDGPASPVTPEHAAWWENEKGLWERQDRLSALKEWILAQPGIETSGYIESVNNPESGSTILLWHGPANSMQQLIRDKGRQMGIPVGVQQRKYGRDDLERAQEALLRFSGKGVFANFRMDAVGGISADFDGTFVTGDYLQPPTGRRADADAALTRAATAAAGIPVKVESGVTVTPADGTQPGTPQHRNAGPVSLLLIALACLAPLIAMRLVRRRHTRASNAEE